VSYKTTAYLAALLVFSSTAHTDVAKDKAVADMRRIANAMKECPEELQYQNECAVHYIGPPSNVEWDVVPSKTVRSPFQGVLEFTLPMRSQDVDSAKQSKRVHQKCLDMASAAASALTEEMREGPKWREGHYRYEFDLGADGPELVKMLWIAKDRNGNIVTSAANDEHYCWIKAIQSATKTSVNSKR
jgi:hypothetical protein